MASYSSLKVSCNVELGTVSMNKNKLFIFWDLKICWSILNFINFYVMNILKNFIWVYLKLWINFLHDFITRFIGLLEILIHWIMETLQTLTNLYNIKKSHLLIYHWFHQKCLKYWEAVMLTVDTSLTKF